MDVYHNVPVSGALPATSTTQDSFSVDGIVEGGEDVSLEWLSIYVEDCLSSTTSYNTIPSIPSTNTTANQTTTTPVSSPKPHDLRQPIANSRAKRRKIATKTPYAAHHELYHTLLVTPSDPPLLHQTQWLADSELIFPRKEAEKTSPASTLVGVEAEERMGGGKEEEGQGQGQGQGQQPRRCSHCLSHRTPQWRAGPLGPKTLCNACGVRFKSGRLLPEYRPAKSPTFVSYKHSNSHKKVMEMRMAIMPNAAN